MSLFAHKNSKFLIAIGWLPASLSLILSCSDAKKCTPTKTNQSQDSASCTVAPLSSSPTSTAATPTSQPASSVPSDTSTVSTSVSKSWDLTLSTNRYSTTGATLGTKILFAGGYGIGTDRIDIFDTNTASWALDYLPVGRFGIATATIASKVIFAGGRWNDNSEHLVSNVDIYDCTTEPCILTSSSSSFTPARSGAATAVTGSKAIFAGGWIAGATSNAVNIYEAGSWMTAGPLSIARAGIGSTSVESRALFAGGNSYDQQTYYDRVDIYDCSASPCIWTNASLSLARSMLGATSVGKKAFFAGGQTTSNSSSATNRVDIFDCTSSCAWSQASLPSASGRMIAATIGTKALFLDASGNLDIYESQTGTWSTGPKRPRTIVSVGFTVQGTKLFVGAGSGDSGVIDFFDTASLTWSDK